MSEHISTGCFVFDAEAFRCLKWSMSEEEYLFSDDEAPCQYSKSLGLDIDVELYTQEGIWTVSVVTASGFGSTDIVYHEFDGLTIGQADKAKLLADDFIVKLFCTLEGLR